MLNTEIKPIVNSKDLTDILLSKTQRKTPTVVHPGYKITRIRAFYMRKVKFFQQQVSDKFDQILKAFPKVEDLHPFYNDLINVLYDRDHYKLALGHIRSTKSMTQNITRDYLKLLKYSDSLYRCKMLKKACLGRICTTMRKINSSLTYLQQVRKHLSRLPSINPFQRTLIVAGYPNVGKSSFVNKLTRANVQVQPYPFTTQNLYVGHFQHMSIRWQLIDSPGLLDHPLQEMNTIQMQSITALAHIKACILFFIDLSQQCGYSINKQIALLKSLQPLLKQRPLLILYTKCDLRRLSDLPQQDFNLLKSISQNNLWLQISNIANQNIEKAKIQACNLLAKYRQKQNIDKVTGLDKIIKQDQSFLRGIYISKPIKRDEIQRPAFIPQIQYKQKRPTFKTMEQQYGGAGVFSFPLEQQFLLENNDWKYDMAPQIIDGKNVADFVDPDIVEKLEKIQLQQQQYADIMDQQNYQDQIQSDYDQAYRQVKNTKQLFKAKHHLNRNKTNYSKKINSQQLSKLSPHLSNISQFKHQYTQKIDSKKQPKQCHQDNFTKAIRERNRSRSKGYIPPQTIADKRGKKQMRQLSKVWRNKMIINQSDRTIPIEKPKHLNSGKTSSGSRNRR